MSEHSAERLLELQGPIVVTGLRVRVFVQQRARVSLDGCELTAAHDDPLIVGLPHAQDHVTSSGQAHGLRDEHLLHPAFT